MTRTYLEARVALATRADRERERRITRLLDRPPTPDLLRDVAESNESEKP